MPETTQHEQEIFISYKRKSEAFAAKLIAQNLGTAGLDVFVDFESINSGRFENVILNEVARRRHFIVLVSPSWISDTRNVEDWCRRECERALELKKNVVPILIGLSAFDPAEDHPLVNQLRPINSLTLVPEYFDAAMEKLKTRFLTQPTLQELEHMTAEEFYQKAESARGEGKFEEAVRLYTNAIALNPKMTEAFCNRATAKYQLRDLQGALDDLDQAILLDPGGEVLFQNKGHILQELGRDQEAIDNYQQMFTGKKRKGPGVDMNDPDNAWMFN